MARLRQPGGSRETGGLHSPLSPRVAVASVGAALAISAILGVSNNRARRVVDEDEAIDVSPTPAPRSPERIDLRSYFPPPQHGVIVKPFESSGGRKKVIYLVDEHPMKMTDYTALTSQRDLYWILRDMIIKFGEVPVVFENLPIGVTADDMAAMPLEDKAAMDMDGSGDFARLFGASDLGKRRIIAEEMVGKSLMPAGMFAMAAHPEIIPVGSTTPDEAMTVGRQAIDQQALIHALEHRDEVPCDDHGRLNLEQASSAFERGDRSSPVVDCYCGVRAQMEVVVDEFLQDRYVEAPWREISAAAGYPGDFVVVIAGIHHLHRSMQLMRDNGLDFVVVAPRSLEHRFPDAFGPPTRPVTLPDDEAGTCAGYEAAALEQLRRQQSDALMKWLMEEQE